ncbi:MAG: hypothetical protein V3V74_07115 [Nitrosomonadaceae bacterium]
MEDRPDIDMVGKKISFILDALRNCEKYYIVPETKETPSVIFFIVVQSKTEKPVFCAMERKAWDKYKYEDLSLSMKQLDMPVMG